ncbi:MAG: hypothetical protein ACYTGZ_05550 [Planctomycetota bacterium]|jgi:hypothetical protein
MRRRNRDNSKRRRGRKRLIFSLLAALSGTVSWQHLEGIGLGNRHERGFSKVRQMIHRPGADLRG